MPSLVFATRNRNKILEIRNLIGNTIRILSLDDIGFTGEIPEDHDMLEKNASQKAFHIYNRFQTDCFADDTGLEVEAIGRAPGVYSARYAEMTGDLVPGKTVYESNVIKLLREMAGEKNRKARFRTVVSLVTGGRERRFEGVVEGRITVTPRGDKGFGYDPVFRPDGFDRTFAEMELEEKNRISHRGMAIKALTDYLIKHYL